MQGWNVGNFKEAFEVGYKTRISVLNAQINYKMKSYSKSGFE